MDSRVILLLLLGSWAARAGIGCRMAQPLLLSSSAGPGQGSRERRLSVNSAAVAARSGCRCDSLVVPALCVADALAVAVCFAASVGFDARLLFAEALVTGFGSWAWRAPWQREGWSSQPPRAPLRLPGCCALASPRWRSAAALHSLCWSVCSRLAGL